MATNVVNNYIRFIDYLLIYLLIGFSVIPFFSGNPNLLAFTTIILLIYVILNYKIKFERNFVIIMFLLVTMYIGQFLTLDLIHPDFRSIIGTFLRFLFPFIVLYILGDKFFEAFVKLVYVLTVIGLVFWTFENLFPTISNYIHSVSANLKLDIVSNENILIYNTEPHKMFGLIRNAGFAYEGGAYSIILIIAIIFNLLLNNYKVEKKTKIFIIAILSTFSTAGYLALFIIIYGLYYTKIKNKVRLIIFSAFFFLIIGYAFTQLDFLEEKIVSQAEIMQNPYATRGRFASAAADILEWQRNPIFGVGKFDETRFEVFKFSEQHRVNGLAAFLSVFGIIVFIAYLVLIYNSLLVLNKYSVKSQKYVIFQFIALIVMAFSQTCLQWTAFIILLYLDSTINKNTLNN
jgi:hypothetical protein